MQRATGVQNQVIREFSVDIRPNAVAGQLRASIRQAWGRGHNPMPREKPMRSKIGEKYVVADMIEDATESTFFGRQAEHFVVGDWSGAYRRNGRTSAVGVETE